jgi:predicted RNA-binding Zn-ribbon protein involved in translation (DUF1610 family)
VGSDIDLLRAVSVPDYPLDASRVKDMERLSEAEILKILEGQEDVLTDVELRRQERIQNRRCPDCGAPSLVYDEEHPEDFLKDGGRARCINCGSHSTV